MLEPKQHRWGGCLATTAAGRLTNVPVLSDGQLPGFCGAQDKGKAAKELDRLL